MSLDFEGHKLSEIYWKQKKFWVRHIISVFSLHLGNHNSKTTPCWIGKKPKVSHGGRCHGSRTCPARLWKKALKKDEKSYGFSLEKTVAKKPLGRNIPSNWWIPKKGSKHPKKRRSPSHQPSFFITKFKAMTVKLSNIILEPRIAWFPPKIFK